MFIVVKFIVSAALIVAISEIAKRYSFAAALLASLPITSLLAFVWLYAETYDTNKIISLSEEIVWLVLPSMALFIILPLLLKQGMNFSLSMLLSCGATAAAYALVMAIKSPMKL